MRARLVAGSSVLARELIERLADGYRPLIVCSEDTAFLDAISENAPSVTIQNGDPADETVLETIETDVCSVLALDSDPSRTAAIVRTAGATFPDTFKLGYIDENPDAVTRAAIEDGTDRVVDRATAATEAVVDRLSDAGDRLRNLQRVLAADDGPLAIVMHDNPDPDAIASAIALQRLSKLAGRDAEACYFGSISHQENRAFVNLLDIELTNLEAGEDLSEYGGFALVDHSRPGINDQLPEDTPIEVVIDHHPPRGPVEAEYLDLRSDVGATSTLLVEYLQQSAIQIDETVASALLFGIRIDTDEFRREVSSTDFEAAAALVAAADLETLQRVESPSMSPETLETIGLAIRNRSRHGPVVITGVDRLHDRDALAQAADRLLNIEGVTTTLVYGIDDQTVYISARTRGSDLDLGEALRDAFGQIGSAGGHADMAGAQIEIGSFEHEDEPRADVVEAIVVDRFLGVLEARWNRPMDTETGDKYLVEEETGDRDVVVLPPDAESIED
jgi:nanoRNase/pAp phosphatase (c-di-AMP/oligoRNAs hydrolase)